MNWAQRKEEEMWMEEAYWLAVVPKDTIQNYITTCEYDERTSASANFLE